MLAHGEPVEAIACYQQAIALQPDYGEAHLNLGTALAAEEQTHEAAAQFAVAARLRPDRPLWALREAALCPAVFASVEELDEYRANLESRLDACLAQPIRLTPDQLLADAFVPSFNLAHHGRCNRRLMEKFAALFAPCIPRFEPRAEPGRPRIGFVVTPPHEGGFLRAMADVVEHLDARRFQPVVVCTSAAIPAYRRAIGRDDIEWIAIPRHYSQAVQRIAEARCHLLYYRKATADPLGYLLAMTRLAPVQCTSWGTHLTSGIAQIDYYVSSALIESDDADGQYTERLVRLNTIPSFEARPAPQEPASRSQFGLPENGHLYLCPQRLAKFHPAHDELLRRILEADPDGYLVLIRPENREHVIEKLLSRFRRNLGRVARRVLFVPSQKSAAFRGLLSVGDVLLDLPHYGVSLMAYDALAENLPIVTWPGRLKVERYGLAFHRKLDCRETVASSADEYVALALRVAADREFREHLRREIEARKHVLFEDLSVVREHERFFEEVIVS
jgi:predicted O-linked N-acetylglucosamine transferase (SPINDLY family)